MTQERFDFCKGHRFGKIIPLKNIAVTALQEIHLRLGLHAFGDHRQAQVVCHGDNALSDGGVMTISADVLNERAVDLDLVDGQTLELAEAGKTGAEIIQGNAHPQRLEPVQRVDRLFSGMQQNRLGDLQLQLLTPQTLFLQGGLDALDEIAPLKMHRRNIHRHRNARDALLA